MINGELQLIRQAEGRPEGETFFAPRTAHKCLCTPHARLYDLLGERASLLSCIARLEQGRNDGMINPQTAAQYRWAVDEAARILAEHRADLAQIDRQINSLCAQIAQTNETTN